MYRVIISWPIIILLSAAFIAAVGRNKFPAQKVFLALLAVMAVAQISIFLNFETLNSIFIMDDHVRVYGASVDNKDMLLRYGSPFGFNHYFQGGIPAVYLRGVFLQFIPFSLVFGDQTGYQVMLIFFLALIPVSVFFFVREATRREDLSRIIAFYTTFYFGMKGYIFNGLVPVVVSIPFVFFGLMFFIRYIRRENSCLFATVFCLGILGYTHPVVFALCLAVMGMIVLADALRPGRLGIPWKKLAVLAAVTAVVLLPLLSAMSLTSGTLTMEYNWTWTSVSLRSLGRALSVLIGSVRLDKLLFLMIGFLYLVGINLRQDHEKRIVRTLIVATLVFLAGHAFQEISVASIAAKRLEKFEPFVIISGLSCFFLLKVPGRVKMAAAGLLIAALLNFSDPRAVMAVAPDARSLDPALGRFIDSDDFVLMENSAHLNAARAGRPEVTGPPGKRHWLMLLQKEWKAKFFAQVGDDPHPMIGFRDMYITCGLFKGRPLNPENPRWFLDHLRSWGVNKACVWSDTARMFFDQAPSFEFMGHSHHYSCYETRDFAPEVMGTAGGRGSVFGQTPFTFKVRLEHAAGKQMIVINKNYFRAWSAVDDRGKKIRVNNCGGKICFSASRDGEIVFHYPKHLWLNLLAVLALAVAGGIDFFYQQRRKPENGTEKSVDC